MTDNSNPSPSDQQPPIVGVPPPILSAPVRRSVSGKQPLAFLLNLCLGLFLADAGMSLLDDSLILFFGLHFLTGLRGILFLTASLVALLTYGLIGVTRAIPKRVFLPVLLFSPVFLLLSIPGLIYYFSYNRQLSWVVSICQVVVGLLVLRHVQGSFRFRWPLLSDQMLRPGGFNWMRLSAFLLVNLLVVLPGITFYLIFCGALAVGHFSDGFVALRPAGFTVQVRKYARADGKTILLVPMSHVGEPEFYHSLAEGFSADSTILMEGVTDNQNLLTNRITYRRMATSLGLAPQEKQFKPNPVQMVRADIDIDQFTPNTIGFLNLTMLLHTKGITLQNVLQLMQYPQPPGFEKQLFDDLLGKRNRHLLREIREHLLQTDNLVVPWGAAHMPELAREIQKSGFRLATRQEYVAIRFGKHKK